MRDDRPVDRPLILISNDDGIDSLGIHALASALDGLGELCVVAPEHEQSAVGHAITIRDPLRATPREFEIGTGHVRAWAVSGTPADCVKLACWSLLDRPPDLVMSGINLGPNTAVNVMYSGTVSAATEATILGHPAVAVSHCSWKIADYEAAGRYARRIAELVLERGLPQDVLLNVNVPDLAFEEIGGIEVTRLARARWVDELDPRKDPFDRTYYWLAGRLDNMEDDEHNDLGAIERGYVSLTPLKLDLTAHQAIDELNTWAWNPK